MIENPEYFLNAPPGYPYSEPVQKGNFEQLKRFAMQIASADQELQDMVKQCTHEQLINWFEQSHFKFLPQFNPNQYVAPGEQVSALDDPNYRWQKGIGKSL